MSLSEQLTALDHEVSAIIPQISTRGDLEALRRDWLSKEGKVKSLFRELKSVPEAEKPTIASRLNSLRDRLEAFVHEKEAAFDQAERDASLASEYLDLSLPGAFAGIGGLHPITVLERKMEEALRPFGFRVVDGPEVETEYFCFDALNIQPHHPARDMQDTFYTDTGHVLRTHTTSMQSRELQKGELPVKILAAGKAYRNETEDASHQAMFHQLEIVWLDRGLTLAHLMALIEHVMRTIFGKRRKVRFVPKYYPYTEPSIGPQLDCTLCKGSGCSACGGAGWVTVGGAGMIHRNVLTEFKYDPDEVSGFAWGLGTSRIAGQFFGMPTLRAVYDNDLRVFKPL